MNTSNYFYTRIGRKDCTFLSDLARVFRESTTLDYNVFSTGGETPDASNVCSLLFPFSEFVLDVLGVTSLSAEDALGVEDYAFGVFHEGMIMLFTLTGKANAIESVKVTMVASGLSSDAACQDSLMDHVLVTQDSLYFAVDEHIRLSASLETVILQQVRNGFSLDAIREQCLACIDKLSSAEK